MFKAPNGRRKTRALGYRNIYYRKDEQGLEGKLTKGIIPGWHATPENKDTVFGEYLRALASGSFMNRSREAIHECRQYVWLPNNHVENQYARGMTDPATGGRNHGDRVVADALANKALGPEPEFRDKPSQPSMWDEQPKQYWQDKNGNVWAKPALATFRGRFQQWQDDENPRPGKEWESSKEALRGWEDSRAALREWGSDQETLGGF